MATIYSPLPLYAVLTPLVGTVLIMLAGSTRPNLREAWTLLAALAQFSLVYGQVAFLCQTN